MKKDDVPSAKECATMHKSILERLTGGLVVSCQPVEKGPMDRPGIVAAMAQAAVAGGAVGLRIEGIDNLRAVRATVNVPIIGIVKTESDETPVRITVTTDDAAALIDAGAEIVAYDATNRPRPDARGKVLEYILARGAIAMADCATFEDAQQALAGGASILGTTLSGYTGSQPAAHGQPDLTLVSEFYSLGGFVMAEGRYITPELVAQARRAGAHCVTVGSALTRLEHMTGWFADAIDGGGK
jgi:N-acylglucosamine-6-phosphate 2-epimerase